MFRSMPFILIVIIAAIMLFGSFVPLEIKEMFYAISLTIKTVIIFLLPFVIFSLLFKSVVNLTGGATYVIGIILAMVCASSFVALFFSHFISSWIYGFDLSIVLPNEADSLKASFSFALPRWITNAQAMFAGIISGFIMGSKQKELAFIVADKLEKITMKILKVLVGFIPLFIAGFVFKLVHEGAMQMIIKDYTAILLVIAAAQFTYISLAYFLLSNCKPARALRSIKNILPAGIAGFTTMSSAAAMPLTIVGAEANARNKDIARCVVPATVNIHLVGDCFATPVFAYAVLKNYGLAEPALMSYAFFVFYFIIAKFSVAAIPGGGIIVMLPVLESYLGFNGDMMSLITALYILFDPVITCANVLGNGAFAKMIDKIIRQKTAKSGS